jgi:ATP-dependent Clp protease ATP-binding subunit ClpA
MFERFTDDARRIVVYAQEESRLLRHDRIGTEHLLLGLLHDDTPTGAALGEVGVTLSIARDRIGQAQGRGKNEPHGHIPFTPRAKQVLEQSLRHAQRLGQNHIARPHLLRALLDVRDGAAARTLVELGVDLDGLAVRIDELAKAAQPHSDSGSGTIVDVGWVRASSAPQPGRRPRWLHYRRDRQPGDDPAAQLATMVGQRDALANAIRRYGRHDEDCDQTRGCTCGLRYVLDDLDPPNSAWVSDPNS